MPIATPIFQRFPKRRRSGTSKTYPAPTELGRNCAARGYKYVAPLELPAGRKRAFALVDLTIIVATVVLAALVLPMLARPKFRCSLRISCVNNLKQTGLAFRLWSGDNNDRFPTSFYTNTSETLKFPDYTNAFRYFQVMSNELSSPKIVVCPADDRVSAANFDQLSNTNVSYFIGLDADETRPAMFLTGDRNLTSNGTPVPTGIAVITPGSKFGWNKKIHKPGGNVALADGSVQELTSAALATAAASSITNSGTNVMRLLFP
jgi:prepilin-type processing-associated H-X9-DG protein